MELYRIRKDIKDYSGIKSLQDFSYNPNPNIGTIGRFNKDGEFFMTSNSKIQQWIRDIIEEMIVI